jgi:hypothetical protein
MVANTSWNDLITTTLENRRRSLTNNTLAANVLFSWLNKRGNVDPVGGGRTLVEELEYGTNSTFMWYDGYEVLNITPQQVFSAAEYTPKQAAVTVTISGAEQAMNSGREQMIRLMASRIDNAETSMQNGLATAAYSNGTGSGGKELGGLQQLVADAPGTGTVGGIVRGDFAFWRNQFKDAATVFSSLTAANVQALMQEVWTEIVAAPGPQGGQTGPDLIVAGSNAFVTFWNSLLADQRINSPDRGVSGFRSLAFYGPGGEAPVFFDPVCNTNRMYFLSTKYLKLRPYRDRNMVWTDQRTSINQDAIVRMCLFMGNLTMSNAGRQGVIFD